jgi:hypothetical protein
VCEANEFIFSMLSPGQSLVPLSQVATLDSKDWNHQLVCRPPMAPQFPPIRFLEPAAPNFPGVKNRQL